MNHLVSRIHKSSLTSAYFGLDSHKYECLEYLFIFMLARSTAGHATHLQLDIGVNALKIRAV
jgi:hypothetical protein